MQKRSIWIITIILSFTLICLILVQTYWISNAIKIKENQFEQLVNKGLDNIVKEIENREMIFQVVNEMDPYDDVSASGHPTTNYQSNRTSQTAFGLSSIEEEKEVFVIKTSDTLSISAQLKSLGDNIMRFNKSTFQLNEATSQESFGNLRLNIDYNEKLNNRTVFVENVVNKLIQIDVDIKDRIDQETIEKITKNIFNELGIDIRYEYVITENNFKAVYHSKDYKAKVKSKKFSAKLFPSDIQAKNNFIYVYFPEQRNFILKSTGFMALSSVLLTIIIILGFSSAIHIMFKQKRLSQIKNDFVNNMTHELKTPISTISLASQMLKDDSIPTESKNLVYISNIIEAESKRLSYQVEKVLKTALFDQGQFKLKRRNINIHNIIETVVKNFNIQVKSQKGELITKLEAKNPVLFIDEVHFTNIIFNLLDNALKYSDTEPNITILTWQNKKGVYVSVVDKGIGIKKQEQKRIFDQFYRVSTGNVHNVKGFGLGLSYVKKIVEAHNGNIRLKSEVRRGTTFEIFIPINNTNNG
ncbi:MAG: HAMP domain-containing sensor histidine kinase [Bacteroidales bacterium]|jgi:two-component system phosphate regulon sensor histidine kinase PhoR|nr:HAMP domain-containing sensor histidine kinase [Bacteroidales bacterium]